MQFFHNSRAPTGLHEYSPAHNLLWILPQYLVLLTFMCFTCKFHLIIEAISLRVLFIFPLPLYPFFSLSLATGKFEAFGAPLFFKSPHLCLFLAFPCRKNHFSLLFSILMHTISVLVLILLDYSSSTLSRCFFFLIYHTYFEILDRRVAFFSHFL